MDINPPPPKKSAHLHKDPPHCLGSWYCEIAGGGRWLWRELFGGGVGGAISGGALIQPHRDPPQSRLGGRGAVMVFVVGRGEQLLGGGFGEGALI